ncbi:uncharacterized protein [Rutidosis leptorrhynchoides]|uniref:uncharacterized protein n=1 Tax=Rutidosis leptorrhynchoides TaxID=125765 RepID=UPI003A990A30
MVRLQSPTSHESETPIIQLKFNYPQFKKVFKKEFKKWYFKHSNTIVVTAETLVASVFGGVVGGSVQFITANILPLTYQGPLLPIILRGPPIVQARNVAVMTGVLTGLSVITKKDNVQNNALQGFCAGFVSALTAGAKGSTALSNGLFFALMFGGLKKVKEDYLQQPQPKHAWSNKTTGLLLSSPPDIDLHNNNNIQMGESIANSPLPLLINSDLQEEVKDSNGEKQQVTRLDHTQETIHE